MHLRQSPTLSTTGEDVNFLHHWLCRSNHWRYALQQRVPWVLDGHDLGSSVLELGPGPGLTTDLLRLSIPRLTVLELDSMLAKSLRSRLAGTNVEVVAGDSTAMPFADEQFSAGVSFTMLHHVPSPELQDQALREMWRVLKPGGIFVGSDSLQSWFMTLIHIGDTLVPLDPVTFGARLAAAGFRGVLVERDSRAFRFYARRPPLTVSDHQSPAHDHCELQPPTQASSTPFDFSERKEREQHDKNSESDNMGAASNVGHHRDGNLLEPRPRSLGLE